MYVNIFYACLYVYIYATITAEPGLPGMNSRKLKETHFTATSISLIEVQNEDTSYWIEGYP